MTPTDVNIPAGKSKSESLRLKTRLLIIAVVISLIGAVGILVGVTFEFVSLPMAILAWAVCVISSLAAHVAGEYPSGDDNFAARMALSIAVRSGPPFLAVVIVKSLPSLPFESGFVFLVILIYLVGLIVDVALHVARLKPAE